MLGGRVTVVQPARGNRAAIDAVVLAAAVPARAGQRVLELGCGTGAAALCLAARVPGVCVHGIDLQADLIALAEDSARASGLAEAVTFAAADLLALPADRQGARFDHVMANPPHLRAGQGRPSPDRARALAYVEGVADLAAWIGAALAHLAPGGSVTFIHRADRAVEVAGLLAGAGADTVVFPLWPKRAGRGAKRALIQGALTGVGRIRHADGLVLHASDGAFTPEAEAILRHGRAIAISAD